MPHKIAVNEIPIFQGFDRFSYDTLMKIFKAKEGKQREVLVLEKQPVKGLYVILDGEVVVELQEHKTQLATISRGGSFGEMSLIKDGEVASASIIVKSETLSYLFCDKETFMDTISRDREFGLGFFKGTSLMLSERLKVTNERIDQELTRGYERISTIMEELDTNSKIDQTKDSLDQTGSELVKKLFEK